MAEQKEVKLWFIGGPLGGTTRMPDSLIVEFKYPSYYYQLATNQAVETHEYTVDWNTYHATYKGIFLRR